MNLYDVCMQVLDGAGEADVDLKDDMTKEYLANEIYELYYEYQIYSEKDNIGYVEDLKQIKKYSQAIDEDS